MKYPIQAFLLVLIFLQPLFGQGAGELVPASLPGHPRTWHLPEGAIARLGKGFISAYGNHAVDFSSDGRYLAVASSIGVWIYEVATNRYVTLLPTETQLTSVAFSPDGATLATGLHNHTIALWQVNTGRRIGTLRHDPLYFPIAVFSPDGTILASGSNDGTVQLWDPGNRTVVAVLEGHTEGVRALAFSPDGSKLATAGDQNIKLWDVAARMEIATLEGHRENVETLAFSPDGAMLASGSRDDTARLWNVATAEQIATLNVRRYHRVWSVAFSPDGSTLTVGSYKMVIRWEVDTGGRIAGDGLHGGSVNSLTYSPAEPNLLVSSSYDGVVLHDLESGSATILGDFHHTTSMAIAPDGTRLIATTGSGRILRWDLSNESEPSEIARDREGVFSVGFSPDGNTLATTIDGYITIWDLATGNEIAVLNEEWLRGVDPIAFSPDGSFLASGGSRDNGEKFMVRLWDVANRREVLSLKGHAERIQTLAFSPDGTILASGSFDTTVKMWDVAAGKEIATLWHLNPVESVVFSHDGNTLVSAELDESMIRLWNSARGIEIGTLEGHERGVYTLAYSPDTNILASGSWDETVRLWDVDARKEIATLRHPGGIRSVAFSFYKPIMASRGWDGTVLIWDVSPFVTPLKPDPDFDDNGTVDFTDFVRFATEFGFSHGDAGYDARYDLDGDGTVGFSDFLIFAKAFGQSVGD